MLIYKASLAVFLVCVLLAPQARAQATTTPTSIPGIVDYEGKLIPPCCEKNEAAETVQAFCEKPYSPIVAHVRNRTRLFTGLSVIRPPELTFWQEVFGWIALATLLAGVILWARGKIRHTPPHGQSHEQSGGVGGTHPDSDGRYHIGADEPDSWEDGP